MSRTRVLIILLVIFISFGALAAKLFEIQIVNHNKFVYSAKRQQDKPSSVKAERGLIKDRDGMVLSYTRDDYSYYAHLNQIKSEKAKTKVAEKFSEVFGKSKKHYLRLLNSKKKVVCLEKKASKEKAIMLREFIVEGLKEITDFTRIYPYKNLAAHTIGYVDKNNKNGVDGIEKYFDAELQGEDGFLFIERDVIGRTVTINDEKSYPSIPGNDIYLTIKKNYQLILDDELSKGIKEYEANSAIGVMMDPNTGEILAISNVPSFDPNKYNNFTSWQRKNRALTDTYEPGSTIKSIVIAMLLEEKLARSGEWIDTENGVFRRRGALIRDTHKFERLTVRGVLEQSSNVGISKLSDRIPEDTFYKYLRNFGFGNKTEIELLGEASGRLKKPNDYSRVSKSSMSYGYEISVTPIQLAAAYAALINGGNLLRPYIVKKITDRENNTILENSAFKLRSVISNATSEKLKQFMVGVVEEGTGRNARLDDILIGGKTGTTKKLVDGKYSSKNYNSSFIGFFPAENPQLVCLILFDSPKIGKYGSQVAAPVFKNIVSRIVESDVQILKSKKNKETKTKLLDELFTEMNKDQTEQSLLKTSNINSATGDDRIAHNGDHRLPLSMPNLKNKSKRYALNLLYELGLKADIEGSGRVVSQSIKPGTKIKAGALCRIECSSTININ
ncbi:MAG: transpeptidase family protein [Ignavibacteriae bacterium]|nr:PASTA domain-containing protein [Ignavibacteriota bacterium]NOG97526.1 transpeptidase family protein [Ignavibacteriota bacterium]